MLNIEDYIYSLTIDHLVIKAVIAEPLQATFYQAVEILGRWSDRCRGVVGNNLDSFCLYARKDSQLRIRHWGVLSCSFLQPLQQL